MKRDFVREYSATAPIRQHSLLNLPREARHPRRPKHINTYPAVIVTGMPFCKHCGGKMLDEDVFCPECGAKTGGSGRKRGGAQQEEEASQPAECADVPEGLTGFIDECRRRGFDDATIREELHKAGWHKADVEKALGLEVPKPAKAPQGQRGAEPAVPHPPAREHAQQQQAGQMRTVTVGSILSWLVKALVWTLCFVLGLVFFFTGLNAIRYSPLGLVMILIAVPIIPFVRGFMRKVLKVSLSGGVVLILIIVGLVLLGSVQNRMASKPTMIEQPPIYEEAGCSPQWECTDWSDCIDGVHYRECWDTSMCGTDEGRPNMKEPCSGAGPYPQKDAYYTQPIY